MDEFVILIILFLSIICVCIFSRNCNRENNTDSVYLNVVDRNRNNASEIVHSYDTDNIPDISLNNLNSLFRTSIIDIIESNSNCYQCEENNIECIICLDTIKAGDTLRNLRCMHKFHKECIDDWLQRQKIDTLVCPVCETSIIDCYDIENT